MFKYIAILSLFFMVSFNGFSQIPVWKKSINTTVLNLAIDNQGSVISTGIFSGKVDFDPGSGVYYQEATGLPNAFISKIDSNGDFQWAFGFGGSDYDWCYSATTDSLGNIYATGAFYGTADFDPSSNKVELTASGSQLGKDLFIIKLDPQGQLIWVKQIGGGLNDEGKHISIDQNGDLLIVGEFYGTVDFDPGIGIHNIDTYGTNLFALKLTKNGDFKWVKNYRGTQVWVKDVYADDSNIVISGMYQDSLTFQSPNTNSKLISNGYRDGFVLHLNEKGDFKSVKSIGGSWYDEITDAIVDGHGNLYVCGFYGKTAHFESDSLISKGKNDAFICKYHKNGKLLWLKNIEGIEDIEGHSILIDFNGNLIVGGSFRGVATFNSNNAVIRNLNSSFGNKNAFILKLDTNGNFIDAEKFDEHPLDNIETMTFGPKGHLHVSSDGNRKSSIWKFETCEAQFGTTALSACKSRYSLSGNQTWTKSGIFKDYLKTSGGCDSIVTVNLTINRDTAFRNVSACKSFTSPIEGKIWKLSGSYSEVKTNGASCDSLIVTNLTVTTPNTSVYVGNDSIKSNAIASTYQWINCNNNQLIPGATAQVFKSPIAGSFKVEIDENGCKDTSECFSILLLNGIEWNSNSNLSIYPNPTEGLLNIDLPEVNTFVEISIFSSTGQLIDNTIYNNSQSIRHTLNCEFGVYIIEVKLDNNEVYRSQVFKK